MVLEGFGMVWKGLGRVGMGGERCGRVGRGGEGWGGVVIIVIHCFSLSFNVFSLT